MNAKDYIKFTGLNTDEIKDFVSNGDLKINQIREGNAELKIPHQFEYEVQFAYLGGTRELEIHPSDYLVKFEDKTRKEDYYSIVQEKNWESSKKYLKIKEE